MNELVGTPYLKLGRNTSGFDCFGLVWYVYKSVLNIDIDNEYRLFEPEEIIQGLEAGRDSLGWFDIDEPNDYDVCLMYKNNRPVHIGIFWKGRVLNSIEGRGVCWLSTRALNQVFTKLEFHRCRQL